MEYRQLAEYAPTCILVVRDGNILYANPAVSVFSGYNDTDLIGKDLLSFVSPSDHNEFTKFIQGCINSKTRTQAGVSSGLSQKPAIYGWLYSSQHSLIHESEPAILINLVDISEKQRFEDRIKIDNERRRGIIITVAHELRTPLQPILGYLNLLVQDPEGFGIPDDTKKILERCLVSVERERQIINQMLELSVLESGRLHLSYSRFPLAALVKNVLDTNGYFPQADITIDIPDTLILTADMDRLFGVFDALLSNAINFSKPPREITIFYHSGIR